MNETYELSFKTRPTLLSVLGDQLVSNEIIAIKELVVNAYDADAKVVNIDFGRDKDNNIVKLRISDDGCGMSKEVIEDAWFVAATDYKTEQKTSKTTSIHKRPIMGEKGVGRFACMKLGKKLNLITNPVGESLRYEFGIDWQRFIGIDHQTDLSDIKFELINQANKSIALINDTSGTTLSVSGFDSEKYDDAFIKKLNLELSKLLPPFHGENDGFQIFVDGVKVKNGLLLENALYYLEGIINEKGDFFYIAGTYPRKTSVGNFIKNIQFNSDIEEQLKNVGFEYKKANIYDLKNHPQIVPWVDYIKSFENRKDKYGDESFVGNFKLAFYSWDRDARNLKKVGYDNSFKETLDDHCGVAVYRDGFRVWPYGEPGNDWLELDKKAQGSRKPRNISNQQIVGYVEISQESNPYLRDQSNREGLIREGYYYEDFTQLTKSSLSFMEELRFRDKLKTKSPAEKKWWTVDKFISELDKFEAKIESSNDEYKNDIKSIKKAYINRKKETESKIKDLLDISATGVIYESVTHELISFLLRIDEQSKYISNEVSSDTPKIIEIDKANILLNDALKIVLHEVKTLQPFFKAARVKRKLLDAKDVAEKTVKFLRFKLEKVGVKLKIIETSPMKVKVVEGFLLQVLSNLIDNSIYWLQYNTLDKEIIIYVNGDKNEILVSDNGIGIEKENEPYIFDAFFSNKKDGRGLGLFICNELISNYKGTIELSDEKLMKNENDTYGAGFRIYIPEDV